MKFRLVSLVDTTSLDYSLVNYVLGTVAVLLSLSVILK